VFIVKYLYRAFAYLIGIVIRLSQYLSAMVFPNHKLIKTIPNAIKNSSIKLNEIKGTKREQKRKNQNTPGIFQITLC
jgi:hypothetical protein